MIGLRKQLTFANVVSVIALFIALGGVGYAASKINGKTIKQNSIPANRLTKSARTSLQGQQGPPGSNGATHVVVRTNVVPNTSGTNLNEAACNAGERALAGGVTRSDGATGSSDVTQNSFPEAVKGSAVPAPAGATPVAWHSVMTVASTTNLTFYVICASP